FRSTSPLRRRIGHRRRREPFALEAIERGVQGADGYGPSGSLFNLAADRDAVSVVIPVSDRQKSRLLEFPQSLGLRHYYCSVALIEDPEAESVGGVESHGAPHVQSLAR